MTRSNMIAGNIGEPLGASSSATSCARTRRAGPPALTLIELLVMLAIASAVILFLLMAMPRGREEARLLGCRNNLFHIGVALAMYDQSDRSLPFVGEPAPADRAEPGGSGAPGPLRVLLESIHLPDMTQLNDAKKLPPAQPGTVVGEMPVPGFVCPSDPRATGRRFAAPISYRAVTGDSATGDNGAFAPGRTISLAQVESSDGLSFTAAFSERLVGDDQPGQARLNHYQVVPGPLSGPACPPSTDITIWGRDAGSSWRTSDYRSTLYNHALAPNGMPSCIASDGKTAFMGAASGHTRGLNLLTLDGAVTLVRTAIDPKIWRGLAEIGASEINTHKE